MPNDVPLTRADIATCKRWCATLASLKEEIESAQRAGENVDDQMEALQAMQRRFDAIVTEYGPRIK